MYSDDLLKLPFFTIQKNFMILLTVYSLSPHLQTPIYLIRQTGIFKLVFANNL